MLSWLRRRRERKARRAFEAGSASRYLFGDAYGEAVRRRREAARDAEEERARRAAAAAVSPRKSKGHHGLDTATRMARDADFSRPREAADGAEPEPISARAQLEELTRILRDPSGGAPEQP